jgi:hypothetical protein
MAIIKKVQKGQTPTLLDTTKANELIDKINALQKIEVVESDKYHATVGSSKTVIEIKKPPTLPPQNNLSGSSPTFETLELHVCIDGEVKLVNFYVESITNVN